MQGKQLLFESSEADRTQRISVEQLRSVTVIGDASIDWRAVQALSTHNVPIWVYDSAIRLRTQVGSESSIADAKAVLAQAELASDEKRRLELSQSLVTSKINNYAVLGQRYWKSSDGRVREMFELAEASLSAENMEQLLGFEGRAAAVWYGCCIVGWLTRSCTRDSSRRWEFCTRIDPVILRLPQICRSLFGI